MMSLTVSRRRKILKCLLLEEMEDDEVVRNIFEKKRAKKHRMFELKNEEGFFENLVINHLREDGKKFTEYFRLSVQQFDFLLGLIEQNLATDSYNRNQYPITPDEKLAITLRYVSL